MKTIIGDKLEEYKIIDSLGEEIGKVKDVIVDTTQEKWLVQDVIVSTGLIEKKAVCFDDINTVNEDEHTITLKDDVTPHDYNEEDFSRIYIPFEELKKRDVYCENDKEIGNIYDYVIGAGTLCWEIQNLLIKPKGEWLKGRRIRMSIEDVNDVKDTITVTPSMEDIQKKCVEE